MLPAIAVDAAGGRAKSGHETRARGIADGGLAVGIGEQNSAFCELIHVGCLSLKVPATTFFAQATDPVIEIIDRNEQYMIACLFGMSCRRYGKGAE